VNSRSSKDFIARDGQLLRDHLEGVAEKAKIFASKIGLAEHGELIGLLHDFGKYSKQFQDYIKSATGKLDPDIDDNYVEYQKKKGKIDHSTAGGQWLWELLKKFGKNGQGELCAQILSLCIASHHSGLIDCLNSDGENTFTKRMGKADEKTNLQECLKSTDKSILVKIVTLDVKVLINAMMAKVRQVTNSTQNGKEINEKIKAFNLGFLTRFLFSALIDSDRIDSANPGKVYQTCQVPWKKAIDRLETKLENFPIKHPIDSIRRKISDDCYSKSSEKQGIYTLTVPTGGGKTYASLRYALHHAKTYNLDRIIYIIPYTSIIEQNSEAIRNLIENDTDEFRWVLEHHSNLDPEKQTWHNKLASENWDSPIVLTTMVQFLEVLFGDGTRSVRRLHQLANSVLIFDEIQTLPINCVHLFCNALNFLVAHAKATAVLCSATQPLLNDLKIPDKGQLDVPPENELIKDVSALFDDLKRVDIINKCKTPGWTEEEIVNLALSEFYDKDSCLIIVNTKEWAQNLYKLLKLKVLKCSLFHLSTNQCAEHRKKLLDQIKHRLSNSLPVICISTQLIEAGVDVDFSSVIRFLAGLDSIAQAAGRCNRNGKLSKGMVYVVNPENEKTDSLISIKVGKEKTLRVFSELESGDLLSPVKISRYFQYYFFDRSDEMSYRLSAKHFGFETTLLDLLSDNQHNSGYDERRGKYPLLQQSFMTAAKAFQSFDAPTKSVIVQYGEGKDLVLKLCAVSKEFDPKKYRDLLRSAQRYTVNVFPNIWEKLESIGAIIEISDEGIFYLDEQYYSDEFGLSTESVALMAFNIL
jgi:CRISPR-associated endonuclease/helicase Cas3